MSGKKPESLRIWVLAAVALVMLAVTVFFIVRIVQTRNAYDELAAQTPVPTMSPPALAFRPIPPLFRNGSVGPEVKELQRRLNELGYYTGEIDGEYYEETQAAVHAFQLQHGLSADGIAGEMTLAMLNGPDAQPWQVSTLPPSAEPSNLFQLQDTPAGGYITPTP
jgi:peptidoglycan hydrolase-like protein with peptidoglycan-binding domain